MQNLKTKWESSCEMLHRWRYLLAPSSLEPTGERRSWRWSFDLYKLSVARMSPHSHTCIMHIENNGNNKLGSSWAWWSVPVMPARGSKRMEGSKIVSATQWVQGQPGLHSQALYQKNSKLNSEIWGKMIVTRGWEGLKVLVKGCRIR